MLTSTTPPTRTPAHAYLFERQQVRAGCFCSLPCGVPFEAVCKPVWWERWLTQRVGWLLRWQLPPGPGGPAPSSHLVSWATASSSAARLTLNDVQKVSTDSLGSLPL